jgi:hypothetical protein
MRPLGASRLDLSARKRNPVIVVMLVTPLIVAPLVLAGVYLGFYAGDVWGYSKSILAIVFSTVGFLVAMLILRILIGVIVARSYRPRPSSGAS